ncbi:MAG TPA: glycosyltransferase [Solirubrobacteraceae bacterium]|nr:glycosyltransferase [Solirubrobacteraceae bacterium]
MAAGDGVDVLVVSVAGTIGWSYGARELADGLARAGAGVVWIEAARPSDVRTLMFTDLREAYAARRAARRGIVRHRPRATVYCSTTSALLWPRPGAVLLDATAAANRRGRHGLWQRPLERRRLPRAPVVLGWTPEAFDGAPAAVRDAAIVVPLPVEPSASILPPPSARDLAAVAYVADPAKRGLALTLETWRRARRESETLVVAGIARPDEPGVRFAGRLAPPAFRALLRRARVFLATPREEEYGIAALEALADGAQLVTTPAPGAYPALALARRLDPRLIAADAAGLGAAVRAALDDPRPDYAAAAADLLVPYRRATMSDVLSRDVLPRLVPGWRM